VVMTQGNSVRSPGRSRGVGMLSVNTGFILFIKIYQVFTQLKRLRERECVCERERHTERER
jgi:hypothetical protein